MKRHLDGLSAEITQLLASQPRRSRQQRRRYLVALCPVLGNPVASIGLLRFRLGLLDFGAPCIDIRNTAAFRPRKQCAGGLVAVETLCPRLACLWSKLGCLHGQGGRRCRITFSNDHPQQFGQLARCVLSNSPTFTTERRRRQYDRPLRLYERWQP